MKKSLSLSLALSALLAPTTGLIDYGNPGVVRPYVPKTPPKQSGGNRKRPDPELKRKRAKIAAASKRKNRK